MYTSTPALHLPPLLARQADHALDGQAGGQKHEWEFIEIVVFFIKSLFSKTLAFTIKPQKELIAIIESEYMDSFVSTFDS